MLFSLVVFVFVNFSSFKKLSSEAEENHKLSIQVNSLNLPKNSKAAVLYDGGASLIWSWLLKDIKEVHYFLPNEMRNLPNDAFDFEVYPGSAFERNEKGVVQDIYCKVGSYYILF
jgi:hypothetical protein